MFERCRPRLNEVVNRLRAEDAVCDGGFKPGCLYQLRRGKGSHSSTLGLRVRATEQERQLRNDMTEISLRSLLGCLCGFALRLLDPGRFRSGRLDPCERASPQASDLNAVARRRRSG